MSRRLLLPFGGTASGVITDPGGGGPGGGDPDPTPGWPTTSDPNILALRPASSFRETTLAEGQPIGSTILTDRNAIELQPGYLNPRNFRGPEFQTVIFLEPGTYSEALGTGDFEAVVGTGNTPADTVLATASEGADGVLHVYGSQGSNYFENLTLKALTADNISPKYPAHVRVGAATYFVNCVLDASEGTATTPGHGTFACLGMDGDDSTVLVLYGCTLIPGPNTSFLIQGHGNILGQPRPLTVALINCHIPGAIALGANESTNGEQGRLYIIGCTGITDVVPDEFMDIYTDLPDSAMATAVASHPGNINRGATTWPVPVDGFDDYWAAYYSPSQVGTTGVEVSVPVTDAAPMTVTPGRCYIMRVPSSTAIRAGYAGVTATTAVGNYAVRFEGADDEYTRDNPPTALDLTPDQTLGTGKQVTKSYQALTRYPGDNGWWVRAKFTGAAQVSGSTSLPGLTDCYYTDDGTTLVPVTAGTAHPLMFVRSD